MTVQLRTLVPEDELEGVVRDGAGGEETSPPPPSSASSGGPTDAAGETPLRHTIAVLCPLAAVGAICGAIFTGVVVSSLLGVAAGVLGGLAAYAVRRSRSTAVIAGVLVGSVLLIGLVCAVAFGGPGALAELTSEVQTAVAQAHLLRPPIDLTTGFAALLGWIMAGAGFCAVWVAVVARRPALGMMLPLLCAGIVAISIPDDLKLGAGVVLLVMLGIGLGVLSGDRRGTGSDRLPLAYELRRAGRAVPLLAVVCAGIVVLGRAGFLFPTPVISPQLEAQKPKTQPISEVPDKVLFSVQSTVDGPWVVGVLDVYDGADWLLPPIGDAQLVDIPSSGVVDPTLHPGEQATFTVHGLGGAVLPTLPNTVGIEASGPRLDYDARSGNIRLVDGQVNDGFTYRVAAAPTPQVSDVEKANGPAPAAIQSQFTRIPSPPPAVQALLKQAPTTSRWQEFDYLRQWVLQNITAAGAGTPVAISPDRVQQIMTTTKQASPFEIVAMQAMFARWMGLPARIGYGFDGGVKSGNILEVHPRNGAAFPEVYFPTLGWLPVIGVPAHAQQSQSSNPQYQQSVPGVQPSTDIATPLFLPVSQALPFEWTTIVQEVVVIVLAVALVLLAVYLVIPVTRKAITRYRRRSAARAAGPRARIVEAYAEWRDALIDYGYAYESDTPLQLTQRFARDDEHGQLAWLVTRALWGDLRDDESADLAADAEELSRALQRRLAQAHPLSVRLVAAVSRRSLRDGYIRDVAQLGRREAHGHA